jgi:hypothetical protein
MQLKTRRTRITESYYRECPRSEKRFRKDFFFGKGQLWNYLKRELVGDSTVKSANENMNVKKVQPNF